MKYLKGSKRIERTKPNGEKYFFTEGNIAFPDYLDRPARTMLTSESTMSRSRKDSNVSGQLDKCEFSSHDRKKTILYDGKCTCSRCS